MSHQTWYQDGLYFECQRCGNCCSGFPGYVWVSEEETRQIAEYLGMEEAEFRRRYTTEVKGRGTCLIERENYDCVFYNPSSGCVIYEYRPRQCRTWPFWRENLASPQAWAKTTEKCPGIGQGRLYSLEEIDACLEYDEPAR
ncbi:MAG: YkgJ family cysteine cluster protein [Dehalococcoidia bacterium]